jgi:ADP-heptose:LPS heptosyltransferase
MLERLITVDTSVAHVAGAMGIPTLLLLPFFPDWRWMLQREDTPWYPTMRLYRQQRPSHWEDVLANVVKDLT